MFDTKCPCNTVFSVDALMDGTMSATICKACLDYHNNLNDAWASWHGNHCIPCKGIDKVCEYCGGSGFIIGYVEKPEPGQITFSCPECGE